MKPNLISFNLVALRQAYDAFALLYNVDCARWLLCQTNDASPLSKMELSSPGLLSPAEPLAIISNSPDRPLSSRAWQHQHSIQIA